MPESHPLFADVLLPLPVGGAFTYRVPDELAERVTEGVRVVVQFGARKIYTALVTRVHGEPPKLGGPKEILSILDELPIVTGVQRILWDWMASYYLCYPGEVMNAALPSSFKLASESRVALNPAPPAELPALSEKEELLVEALHHRKSIAVSEVSKILDQQKSIPVIKTLIEKGYILPEEELNDPYKPRREAFIRLTPAYAEEGEALREVFDHLEKRARKQLDLLMTFIRISGFGFGALKEISRKELLRESGASVAQLDSLVEKGIFEMYQKLVSRLDVPGERVDTDTIGFSPAQSVAYDQLSEAFGKHEVVLLHGVTSSGKTELYIKLIREMIDQGKQVLFLLPEIALTAQVINRLRKYFGDRVGVYHSRFNMHERAEIWHAVLGTGHATSGDAPRYNIILGARSAIFLPFSNLGLVVVDEEHDPSFKQIDPAPRYSGRDAAIYLARLHGAKTLLGSATPSIESYSNALNGKYGLVELKERYGNLELPQVNIVNTRERHRQGLMKSHFSPELLSLAEEALAAGEQVILFQNRRGFSLRLECETCDWMPSCKNCDVTLVYHKKFNQLRCHYCGYVMPVPTACPECQFPRIRMMGFGTEKVEEELGILFPDARIARMDLDTTRTKHSHQQIIGDFESGKIDVLVGTQMVTKGLDFDHVSLVGILNADNMLSYPDFRSAERSFQLMAQVSGRSGRKNRQGRVIIQTGNPEHPVIRNVVAHDYQSMYRRELAERMKFGYPPFTRLILLKLKHKDAAVLNKGADELARGLKAVFGRRVLGPEYPVVSRIMNYHIKHILLKAERAFPVAAFKEKLVDVIGTFREKEAFRQIRVIMDVDPQ
ncbi:MAG TPA: primosomal protein N' [Bacteroidales bacterium]|nr:primosomal protein N' [Bacteroidales bacterium]HPS62606.1 primosomal protein N' [Bacteroidales bacterium]